MFTSRKTFNFLIQRIIFCRRTFLCYTYMFGQQIIKLGIPIGSDSLILVMKQLLIFLCYLSLAFSDEELTEGCDPWPSNVRSLRECCNVPYHSSSMLQDMCMMRCSQKEQDSECAIKCYIDYTLLLKEGKLDKAIVKRLYYNNVYYEHQWYKVIDESVDKCEFAPSDSTTQSLAKFYDCVSNFLANNCVSFMQSEECGKTEDLNDKCKKTPPNCKEWPVNMLHPFSCCITPQLISQNLTRRCKVECERKEFFITKQLECVNNCTDAVIKTDGKIDFELVKNMFIENGNGAWETSIVGAIESCEKVIQGE